MFAYIYVFWMLCSSVLGATALDYLSGWKRDMRTKLKDPYPNPTGGATHCTDNFIIASSYVGSQTSQRFGNTAFIYQKVGGIWEYNPVLNITGYTDKAWFGSQVQISDSYAAVIAAQGYDSRGAQTTFIFKRNTTTGKWDDPNHVQSIYLTSSFMLSLSTNYLVIGGSGKVYVYKLTNNQWDKVATFTGPSYVYGRACISPNENFIIVGDGESTVGSNKAFIYERTGAVWGTTPVSTMSGPQSFGFWTSISNNYAFVGSRPLHNLGVWVYKYTPGVGWSDTAEAAFPSCHNRLGGWRVSNTDKYAVNVDCLYARNLDTGEWNTTGYEVGFVGGLTDLTTVTRNTDFAALSVLVNGCQPGSFLQLNNADCSICPAGRFSNTTNAELCQYTCDPGTYAASGDKRCSLCEAGKYTSIPESPSCSHCPGGKYSIVPGALSITTCLNCPVGTYAQSSGSSVCSKCSIGRYSETIGASSETTCLACPRGKYSSLTPVSQCTSCEEGTSSSVLAATNSSVCDICSEGSYSSSGSSSCLLCGKGRYSNGIGAKQSDSCIDGVCCIACPAGKASNTAGSPSSSCTLCGPGFYSLSGSSSCTRSPAGGYSTSGVLEYCPAGRYSSAGATSCIACSQSTYADTIGSQFCTDCVPGRITPGTGSTDAAQCVSPEGNFVTAFMTLIFSCILSYEYIVRGRFHVVAFYRKWRVCKPLVDHAKSISPYLFRYGYKSESHRIYKVGMRIFRVILFGIFGTLFTFLTASIIYLGLMANVIFKTMIIVIGLKIDLPFLSNLGHLARLLSNTPGMQWLYNILFEPFMMVITFFAEFQIDFEFINLTCKGSTAPTTLLVNLIVMGLVVILIESEFSLFKNVTYGGLLSKYTEITSRLQYRTWSPRHYEELRFQLEGGNSFWKSACGMTLGKSARLFSYTFLQAVAFNAVTTLMNFTDIFQNTLQFVASKIILQDFISESYISHSWDHNCNVIKGYPYFDFIFAIGASIVAWLLVFPCIYEISSVLIPGIPEGVQPLPIVDHESSSAGSLRWGSWYREAWKSFSFLAPELWWAEMTHHAILFIKKNTPYGVGDRYPSLVQVEASIVDPLDELHQQEEEPGDRGVQKYAFEQTCSLFHLNALAKHVLSQMEKPSRRKFRVMVRSNDGMGSGSELRFYTCDRVVCGSPVWVEQPIRASGGSNIENPGNGQYALIFIDKTSGQVKSTKSYQAWTLNNQQPCADIVNDLNSVKFDKGLAIVFIKWGMRETEDDISMGMLERSVLNMVKPAVFLSGAHDDILRKLDGDDHSESEQSRSKKEDERKSASIRSSVAVAPPTSTQKKSFLSIIKSSAGEHYGHLMDMAEAIAWCGGDASRMSSTASYILLGTPLRAYDGEEEKLREHSLGYEQWHSEKGKVFEREHSVNRDITGLEEKNWQSGVLLDLEFRTPKADEGGRLLVERDTHKTGTGHAFSKRSYFMSNNRKRSFNEAAEWRKRRALGLPSYFNLCTMEFGEIQAHRCGKWLPNFVCVIIIALGFGHLMTDAGRRAWYVVIWKLWRFLLLCCGYWTDEVVEMYGIHAKLLDLSLVWTHPGFKVVHENQSGTSAGSGVGNDEAIDISTGADANTSSCARADNVQAINHGVCTDKTDMSRLRLWMHHFEETETMSKLPEKNLKIMYQNDCSCILSSIVSTRAVILQLIPGLSVLSVFANFTANTPLFVYSRDLDLSLTEMICHDARGIAAKIESEFTDAVNRIRTDEMSEDDLAVKIPQHNISEAQHGSEDGHTRMFRDNVESHNERSRERVRRCLEQPPLLVKEWVVTLRTPIIFCEQSRALIFLYSVLQFIFVVLLLSERDAEFFNFYVAVTLVLLLPLCIVKALPCYILVGKNFSITDEDLKIFWAAVPGCMGEQKTTGEAGDNEDEVVQQGGKSAADYLEGGSGGRLAMVVDPSDYVPNPIQAAGQVAGSTIHPKVGVGGDDDMGGETVDMSSLYDADERQREHILTVVNPLSEENE